MDEDDGQYYPDNGVGKVRFVVGAHEEDEDKPGHRQE